MPESQIALSRRAIACKGWRWMPGMSTSNRGRVLAVDEDGSCRLEFGSEEVPFWCTPETMRKMTPCLTDPATLGCLLALVREAWGDPQAFVGWFDPHWKVIRCRTESLIGCLAGRGAIEAEALVAALEAAPNTGGEHCREGEK